mmetsp:Transcript_52858/g.115999  ORF Transcript_52858/g.115999 Transcript_52858/m.115999 type:complete len:445 (-) Transcript_52858:187-1521(-)
MGDPREDSLFEAALTGQFEEAERLLGKEGANPNCVDKESWTPLHRACLIGGKEICEVLLRHKAHANMATPTGATPLHIAMEYENEELLSLLVEHKADPYLTDAMGHDCFFDADEEIGEKLRSIVALVQTAPPADDAAAAAVSNVGAPAATGVLDAGLNCDELPLWEVEEADLTYCERIGRGKFSDVYRGRWRGADVAIKELLWEGGDEERDEGNRKMVKRELEVMMRLRHPNLVLFMGAITRTMPLRIICELCLGGSLYDLLHGPVKLCWRQKVKLGFDVARGIYFLHTCKPPVVHRDLKSLNLLLVDPVLTENDIPFAKIADFGLARCEAADDTGGMTEGAGTYHWMAPEVLQGAHYDERVDIYSFAIVLYEIACRKLPFAEIDMAPVAIAIAVTRGQRPSLDVIPSDCPPDMKKLIQDCWAGNPADRPLIREICHTLRDITC